MDVDGVPVEIILNSFPGSPVTTDNIEVYRARMDERMVVRRCRGCATMHEPPRSFCPQCLSSNLEFIEVSGRARVALSTRVVTGPSGFDIDYGTGHPIIVVELDEQPGLRHAGAFVTTTGRSAEIDERVTLCWIRRAGAPTPAFRPLEEG